MRFPALPVCRVRLYNLNVILNVIPDDRVGIIISKDPEYRFPSNIGMP